METDMTLVNSLLNSWQQLLLVSATFFLLFKTNGVSQLTAVYFLCAIVSGAIYFITFVFLDEPIFVGLFSGEMPLIPYELFDSKVDGGLSWLGWIVLILTLILLTPDAKKETAKTSNENTSSQVSKTKEEITADKKPVETSPKKEKSGLFDKKNKLDEDLFDDL